MALPVALAACTSEEIVENASVNLQNREVLPQITVAIEGNVDSRFSWNEETFGWNKFTAEDKFAAGLTDATLWTVGDKMMTNYIFSDAAGNGAYTTTSQMVEGSYFFYSYPGFENVAARQAVPFDLTSQKSVDFKKPAAAVEANQLFVSALYKLDKATANEALPIKFISYWSTAGLKIKNTTGDDIKIVRMMVETKGEKMELRGELSPKALGTVAKEAKNIKGLVYYYNGKDYVLPYDATATTNPSWNDIKTKDIANTGSDVLNALAEETMMLTVENGELAEDAEATVYFQMPAGLYKDAKVTLFVEVYDENEEDYVVKMLEPVEFVKNAKSAATATENDRTAFYRGATTAVFGVEEGAIAAHEIVEFDIINAQVSGAYAASYEDLAEIVKNSTETMISNMGELKVDDAVIKLLNSTTALKRGVYTFVNPIEISSTKTAGVELNNFTVKNATVTAGKITLDYDLTGAITVNPGAELTVKASQTGAITNKGTLNIEGEKLSLNINDGADAEKEIATVVNVKGNNAIGNNVTSYTEYAGKTIVMDKAPTTLNLKANVESNKAVETKYYQTGLTIGYGKTLNVESKVIVTYSSADQTVAKDKLINNGKVVNNGDIWGLNNIGTLAANGTTALQAKVENSGVIKLLTNGGKTANATHEAKALVEQMDDEAEIQSVVESGLVNKGEINNTIGSFVVEAASNVFAAYTGDQTGKIGNVQSIDIIRGTSGTWTDVEFPATAKLELNGVTFATEKDPIEAKTIANEIEMTNGGASYPIVLSTSNPVLNGANFTVLTISVATDVKLVGVTVSKGLNLTAATSLTLAGATLNDVTGSSVATVNVTPKYNLNAKGELTSISAATTAWNGDVTFANNFTLNVQKDATLKVAYGTTVTAGTLNPNVAHDTYTTATGYSHTTCNDSKILNYNENADWLN